MGAKLLWQWCDVRNWWWMLELLVWFCMQLQCSESCTASFTSDAVLLCSEEIIVSFRWTWLADFLPAWCTLHFHPASGTSELLDNLRIRELADCQLVDWTSRGLVSSRTTQLADWTTRGCHRRLCLLSFCSFCGMCETASCPVRELTSARVV